MARTKLTGITNRALLRRLEKFPNGGHGAVILCNRADWVDDVIRLAQKDAFPGTKRRSLWSHCLIVAEPYRGEDTLVMESTVPVIDSAKRALDAAGAILAGKWGGVRCSRLKSLYRGSWMPNMAVLDFSLSSQQATRAIGEGRKMEKDRTYYPAVGLAGTWAFYFVWRLFKKIGIPVSKNMANPLTESNKNHLYCSAFVQKCYLAAGPQYDFTGAFATTSTSPEHLWRAVVQNSGFYVARDR
jgi:hypothetical protein